MKMAKLFIENLGLAMKDEYIPMKKEDRPIDVTRST